MEILIITGLSGAGKSRAADICEDLGYYCVDNLPPALLGRFAALCQSGKGRFERVALGMDVRSVENAQELTAALAELDGLDCAVRILYLEADTATLLRRYKESRRPHPLSRPGEGIRQAIERERSFLTPLRDRADFIIRTDAAPLNKLRARICQCLQRQEQRFTVNVISFGYHQGLPPEADLVFDARCLPNPFYQPELQHLTGLDGPVAEYVFRGGNAQALLTKILELLDLVLPLYKADRSELTVAVGCTGGQHRSVAMAQALADALAGGDVAVSVHHRELEREKE